VKRAEIERAHRKRPDSLDAYDLYLQALPDIYAARHGLIANAIAYSKRDSGAKGRPLALETMRRPTKSAL
jgi:hypothetical protein